VEEKMIGSKQLIVSVSVVLGVCLQANDMVGKPLQGLKLKTTGRQHLVLTQNGRNLLQIQASMFASFPPNREAVARATRGLSDRAAVQSATVIDLTYPKGVNYKDRDHCKAKVMGVSAMQVGEISAAQYKVGIFGCFPSQEDPLSIDISTPGKTRIWLNTFYTEWTPSKLAVLILDLEVSGIHKVYMLDVCTERDARLTEMLVPINSVSFTGTCK
jgi:hypothetical protein